jgi:uncharacterized membrane protein YraQ (UPF0718 family)
MDTISKIILSTRVTTGQVTNAEVWNIRKHHVMRSGEAAVRMLAATTFAFAVGWMLPYCIGDTWWPEKWDLQNFAHPLGYPRLGSAVLISCWGLCKTLPQVLHHVRMVKDPCDEVFNSLRRDIRQLFDDAVRFLIALIVCAVPGYLAYRSIQSLVLA